MSRAPQLYTLYQQLLEKSKMMLQLAREGLWDELIASEMDYVNAVHKLTQFMQDIQPSAQTQEQLRPVLRAILDNESEVKRLLQARMAELARLAGQSSIQKSVLTAYGNQGGHILAPQDKLDTLP